MRRLIKTIKLNFPNFIILIGILCFLSLFSSCKMDNKSQPSLIGRWEMQGHNSTEKVLTLCLYEDSSFTMSAPNSVPQSGKWIVSQDSLTCYGNRNEYSGKTNNYYEFIFKIVRHNETSLFLGDFETHQVMEFERIHE